MTMLLTSFPAMYDDDIMTSVMDGIGELGSTALWKSYVRKIEEKKLTISTTAYTGFGVVSQWRDGAPLPMDQAQLLYNSVLTMVRYGMGFKISRALVDYGELRIAQGWAKSLVKSTNQCYEVNHATILNGAFSTTWTSLGGLPLISASHTTAGSATRSNILTPGVALAPSTLATLKVRARNWTNHKGLNDPIDLTGAKLITPPDLDETVEKMLGSDREPFIADNDLNTNRGRFAHISVPWITSTTAWFIQGTEHGILANHGMAPSPINFFENATESTVIGTKFDFVVGVEFPDGMFGCAGA